MAKVLVIDDESGMRTKMRQILNACGHDVAEAADGLAGMKLLRDATVDLVITDIFMPVQDGLQTIREVRKNHPATKIIAISGSEWADSYDVLRLASKLGADGALRKPFTGNELRTLVTECLHSTETHQEH